MKLTSEVEVQSEKRKKYIVLGDYRYQYVIPEIQPE
jgi:hypothetical protein